MLSYKHSDEPTTPVTVDIGLLWLLEHTIPHSDNNYIGEALDGDGLKEQIHEQLLFCNDNKEEEGTLLLSLRHCKLISTVVGIGAAQPNDPNAGKRLLMKAFRAERTLRYGPDVPVTSKDLSPTKERTLEWLKEHTPDPTDPE